MRCLIFVNFVIFGTTMDQKSQHKSSCKFLKNHSKPQAFLIEAQITKPLNLQKVKLAKITYRRAGSSTNNKRKYQNPKITQENKIRHSPNKQIYNHKIQFNVRRYYLQQRNWRPREEAKRTCNGEWEIPWVAEAAEQQSRLVGRTTMPSMTRRTAGVAEVASTSTALFDKNQEYNSIILPISLTKTNANIIL